MVAAHKVYGRYGGKLPHKRLKLGQLALGLALVEEIPGEGYDVRAFGGDCLQEPGIVLPEARAVQVAELDDAKVVEARRQLLETELKPCDLQTVL